MTEIVLQAEIGTVTFALTETAEKDLDATLDRLAKALSRQRAQVELVQAIVDLQAATDTLEQYPQLRADLSKKRAAERVALEQGFRSAHEVANRRGEFRMTDAQRRGLHDFDKETEAKAKELAAQKEEVGRSLPQLEARVARCRAIIGGADRAELLPVAKGTLAEAAD